MELFEYQYNSKIDEYEKVSSDSSEESEQYRRRSISIYSHRSSRSSIRSNNNPNFVNRIISKTGHRNIFQEKIPQKRLFYFRDLGNTLLNIRWRWIMISLCLVNFLSFYLFGMMFMWIAYISGDFEEDATDFCIVNTKNMTGYILLSIETMLTIGYGYRYPTEKCIQGWVVPFLQALVSIGIQGALVSAIYVKISKPFTKNSLGFFSKKAVVCLRDGKLCLTIRIADLAGKISVGTNITMYIVDKGGIEDPTKNFDVKQIKIEPYGFLIFPVEIIHVIDAQSPLWKTTPYELLSKPIEIIAVAEGLSAITAQASQNRTSYVNSDICWGHRFASCVDFDRKKQKYIVHYQNINKIAPHDTPLCSAQQLTLVDSNKIRQMGPK